MNGNWYYFGGFNTVAPLDKNRWFYFFNFTDWSYSHNVDYLCLNNQSNSIRNTVHTVTLKEALRLDFRKDKLFLGLRGNFYWTHATGKNISTINTFDYSYGLNWNWQLPAEFGLSGDLMMYSRRGLETNQLNTDEFLCNLHLSKSILKGNLVFMLDGFDIFNQLSNIRYSINAQGQTESYYNVVQRYAMLRAIYKFHREPKKRN
ncbi:MAG: outer membrane beta-barrel family protein [Paraprevotella sp.]|nr:outer membrane beta-barrel family protein [Paraprevotella sp.]